MKTIQITHTGGASWKQIKETVKAVSVIAAITSIKESLKLRDDDITEVKVLEA